MRGRGEGGGGRLTSAGSMLTKENSSQDLERIRLQCSHWNCPSEAASVDVLCTENLSFIFSYFSNVLFPPCLWGKPELL